MYSLKSKLNESLVLNLSLVMLLLLGSLGFAIQRLLMDHMLTRLEHDAESLISIIEKDSEQRWSINPAHVSAVYNRVHSGHYYRVSAPGQVIRSRSLFDFEFSVPPVVGGRSMSYQMKGLGGESWLVWRQVIRKDKELLDVLVAEDITPVYQSLLRFLWVAVAFVVLAALLAIYLQRRILGRAFQVFDELRNNLQAIRHRSSGIHTAQIPSEVFPLVREIELLVEQLGLRIQRTRNAIGNLSHEIKRPLQLLTLQAQHEQGKEMLNKALDDIRSIVDRELRRAKISGSSRVGGEFRIHEELPYLVEVMQKIYPAIEIQLNIQGGVDGIGMDRDDMLELMGNLMDNACKFARNRVRCRVTEQHNRLVLLLEDDGPGVAVDLLQKITRKGARLDESVEGHGLGLSICVDIVNSYQGTLDFGRSELGGLRAEVGLPMRSMLSAD